MANFAYISGDPDNLTGGAAANMVDIQGPFVDLETWLNNDLQPRVAAAVPSFVTSLPSSAVDGQEIYYRADDTNGLIWHLRYRAASASSYKWEFVGGSPLWSEVQPTGVLESTSSTTYVALATPGPSLTLPLAGDYMITTAAQLHSTSDAVGMYMSYDIGGTAAIDDDAVFVQQIQAGGYQAGVHSRERRKNGLGAVTLTAKYKVGSLTGNFTKRTMRAIPVRVG